MTETIADRYRRLAGLMANTVAAVDPHRWNDASPCLDWSALDVLRHVIETQGLVAGFVGRELAPGPIVGGDPLGAWISASDQIQNQLDDPVYAVETFDGGAGPMSFESAVDRLLNLDLVIHRWDIGASVDLAVEIDPEDVAWATAAAEAMGDDIRSEGVCGPALDPPADASPQVRLLAYLGRKAW
ncbi:MAG: TIGR03086 family protein [Acidimicrobiales bacterium]|nr:TIGR03086 family protein [Acidimicrobiales bacterium]